VVESQRLAAAEALAAVQADLALPPLRVRWFDWEVSGAEWNVLDPDIALAVLNAPPFEAEMLGKSVAHLAPPVIWVRADRSPGELGAVIAHEARHVWQRAREEEWSAARGSDTIDATGTDPGDFHAAMEDDAFLYSLQAPLTPEMHHAARELLEEYAPHVLAQALAAKKGA
jgi:hypothetical protein